MERVLIGDYIDGSAWKGERGECKEAVLQRRDVSYALLPAKYAAMLGLAAERDKTAKMNLSHCRTPSDGGAFQHEYDKLPIDSPGWVILGNWTADRKTA